MVSFTPLGKHKFWHFCAKGSCPSNSRDLVVQLTDVDREIWESEFGDSSGYWWSGGGQSLVAVLGFGGYGSQSLMAALGFDDPSFVKTRGDGVRSWRQLLAWGIGGSEFGDSSGF